MTAWQIGIGIRRNPASVSSELHKMLSDKDPKIVAFQDKKRRILYSIKDVHPAIVSALQGS